ncbi:MAG: MerR family transcriptional regulator [Acidimicrobiales bacterium]
MTSAVDIGEVVRRSGLPATTLHVWEERGLIAPVGRRGLRRQFSADVFDRLATIVVLQEAGFRLDEIAAMLEPDAFVDGKQLLEEKLTELTDHRDRLDRAIGGIRHAIECSNPSPLECPGFRQHLDDALPARR